MIANILIGLAILRSAFPSSIKVNILLKCLLKASDIMFFQFQNCCIYIRGSDFISFYKRQERERERCYKSERESQIPMFISFLQTRGKFSSCNQILDEPRRGNSLQFGKQNNKKSHNGHFSIQLSCDMSFRISLLLAHHFHCRCP